MRWIVSLLAVQLLCAGCRGLPQPMALSSPVKALGSSKLPDAYRTPVGQLVFYSDFPLPADHRLLRELTAERDYVNQTLGLAPSNEPINVYLFQDAERYQEFLKRNYPNVPSRRAFFLETDMRLAVYAHWNDRMAEDLRHEIAHGYMHSSLPSIPLWLDEGLAEYFEVPRGLRGLNRPHVDLLSDMTEKESWRPNLPRLEKLTEAGQLDQRDYAESWAWVYFFLNSPPERREVLTNYLAQLRNRGGGEPLSVRLAALQVEPGEPLTKYIATLKQGTPAH
jgi:Protein of unknown function (DUF1570)